MSHSQEHEALLQRILTGDLSPEAPEVQELRAKSDAFSRELDELSRVQCELESWAGSEHEVAESSLQNVTDEDEQLVARALDAVAPAALPARAPSTRSWRPWLVAAAVLILAGLSWRMWGSDPQPTPIWMGPEDDRCLEPRGRVEEFAVFRWNDQLTGAETYTLQVFNKGDLDPAVRVEFLREATYTLTAEERTELGTEIYWQVSHSGGTTYGAYASRP